MKPEFTDSSVPVRQVGFRVDREGEETVLINDATGQVIRVNTNAMMIWQLCDGTLSVAEIVALLVDLFPENKEQISTDVIETLSLLQQSGILLQGADENAVNSLHRP